MKFTCKACGGSVRYYEEVMGSFTCDINEESTPNFANREFVGDAVSIGVECAKDTLHECGYYFDPKTKKVMEDSPKGILN